MFPEVATVQRQERRLHKLEKSWIGLRDETGYHLCTAHGGSRFNFYVFFNS